MKKTSEYFNKSIDELLWEGKTKGLTNEECLLADAGLEVVYFDDEAEMKEEEKTLQKYMNSKKYQIKDIVLTVNERVAVILY